MTTIQIQEKSSAVQQIIVIGLLLLAILSSLVVLWVIREPALAMSSTQNANLSEMTITNERLSASAALAAEKPILFVFTPVQECEIHYCLTADVVKKWVSQSHGDQVNVVEVPVYAAHIYNNGTPPRLFASWDLIPDTPYSEWMPTSELTDFGWGLAQTEVVFVSADKESNHHFTEGLDMQILEYLLQ